MKLGRLIENLEVLESTADPELEISGISYDSRKTEPGGLFVAIKGFEADGHRFIPKAVENGAAAVVCEDAPADGTPYVRVKDCRHALAIVSRDFCGNPAGEMKLIGFTGTSGKTSSTYILKHVLETAGAKVGLIGTNGNMIGDRFLHTEHTTPESLELHQLFREMRDAGCTHVVMEVSSHSLVLSRVAGIIFDVAVFTNLSQDHLDLHGTMEEYAAAKKRIFSQCRRGCVNADDARGAYMAEGADCPILRYTAEDKDAELMAKDIRLTASGVRFAAVHGDELALTRLAIPGMFSVYNALGVLAACLCLGMSLSDAAAGVSSALGVKGRMESVPTDGDYSIIIDYSHKPDALEKALKALRPVTKGRLIVLFGCGGDRDRGKRPIMGEIAADNADLVIVTSDNPRTEDPMDIIREILPGVKSRHKPYKMICDRPEAIRWAIDNAGSGDVILLAGKGHEDYQIIGHEKHHMDEREIVADWLKERRQDRIMRQEQIPRKIEF
ncbi:MAG: UDP-N-acetylmuramoyl-L-alanyl-D-glutamate--2,6-diaminopimelate ligase [Oscillospiraceae bacterium]|nr:UDP-N-acetylmuramoyl-L-alanyl-D-glutamate--2,6-diaminopimelate ligase [Oscillospiraceae bacterium]